MTTRTDRSIRPPKDNATARAEFEAFAARLEPHQYVAVEGPPGPRYPYAVTIFEVPARKVSS